MSDADHSGILAGDQILVTRAEWEVVSALPDVVRRLTESLAAAKRTIATLLSHMHGVKSERIQVLLDAEGQLVIDPSWFPGGQVPVEVAPVATPAADGEVRRTRPQRDGRGLAQRHPHLPIEEQEAPVPPEIAEQVQTGVLAVHRSAEFHDALVVPEAKPFIRRTYEVEVIAADSGLVAMTLPVPEAIVPGGILADETVSRLVVAKFLDAIPFHRTLAAWHREGLDISRQTVNDAFAHWHDTFKPLATTILDLIFHDQVVHVDESWARRQEAGACARVNIWTMVGQDQVGYIYTQDRTHDQARVVIPAWFAGYLVRDAWQGWLKLDHIAHAGCNAHARRPFAAQLKITPGDPDAKCIVALYQEVYRLEHRANDGPAEGILDRRRLIRDQETRPIMLRIRTEADRIATAHPFTHPLAKGARYIQNHWDDLIRFLDNPLLPPDNNAAENALRINALIRKNSMFFGSDAGGERAATALTILHSCRLAGLNPHDYLARVTPALLRHRQGRSTDLAVLTPRTLAEAKLLPVHRPKLPSSR